MQREAVESKHVESWERVSTTQDERGSETTDGRVAGPAAANSAAMSTDAAHLPKIVTFETLARCGDEVWIEHAGMLYRLRKTRQGKLILTK